MKFKYEITLDVELDGNRKGITTDEIADTIRSEVLDKCLDFGVVTIKEDELVAIINKIKIK